MPIENANKVNSDLDSDLNSPENMRRLARLALYQPIIYCDDTYSMTNHDGSSDSRFDRLSELAKHIASVANRLLPDGMGVHLRFINDPGAYDNLSAAQVAEIMHDVTPDGEVTPLGTILTSRILEPFVYDGFGNLTGHLQRPLLICVITDGCPNAENPSSFKDAILSCKHRLVSAGCDPGSVVFLISQIGKDDDAVEFIQSLRADIDLSDAIYCTSDRLDSHFEEFRANERKMEAWLLKVLTQPLMG
jgi:hypothetical protein